MSPQKAATPKKTSVTGIIGMIAFIAGMILAVLGGIWWKDVAGISLTLVIMGIIVGLLNITAKEAMPFLVAAIALVVVGNGSFTVLNDIFNGFGTSLNGIVGYIATLMVPAAIINAIRTMWQLAKPGE
jgi:hypothetical protein